LSAWTLYQARNYELALDKAQELLRLSPEFMQSHLQLANVLGILGDAKGALAHIQRAVELGSNSALTAYPLCTAFVRNGMMDEARAVYEHWSKVAEHSYVAPYFLALCNVALGNKEKAVELLEAARLEHSAWILWLATEPKLDSMRDFEPFIELVKKTGLPV
jgi:tetratricopeptide (TPR) repeat protein